jgi:circadian clock protein KaiB
MLFDSAIRLRLYVAGSTPRSLRAVENLQELCGQLEVEDVQVEIVDLLEDPNRARQDDIVAIPTLVRREPSPARRVIGDLSDRQRVVTMLELPVASFLS